MNYIKNTYWICFIVRKNKKRKSEKGQTRGKGRIKKTKSTGKECESETNKIQQIPPKDKDVGKTAQILWSRRFSPSNGVK